MLQDDILKLKFDNSHNGRLFAVQADTGRVFNVQILTNMDEVVDVTGMSLKLYVGNSKEVTYSDGEITDAAEGRFKILLYNSQLKYAGVQKAQFVLIGTDGLKIGSKVFDIYVEEGLDNGATMGTNVIADFETIQRTLELLESYDQTLEEAKTVNASLEENIQSATAAGGAIRQKIDIIDGWIANPEQFKGDKGAKGDNGVSATHSWNGTTLTITSASGTSSADLKGTKGDTGEASRVTDTGTDAAGNTTVTFNDGTTITVAKGTDGTMSFEDLTPEQKESLRGPQGIQGERGPQGERGIAGEKGADGVSVTHSWNGTTLNITSASGTTSADLKGEKGDRGDPATNLVKSVNGQTGEVVINPLPTGGMTGQVLKKTATGYEWQDDKDTVYTHPANHDASMITESTTKRFVTDAEKASWNAKTQIIPLTQAEYDALSPEQQNMAGVAYGITG